jgi:arylsulfatase A-like enzyme
MVEGAGMPALVLPPPARVRHVVAGEGPLWLATRVGIDHSVREDVGERYADHALRFTLRLDGEEVFAATLPIQADEWVHAGSGYLVGDGTVIELETALLDPAGKPVTPEDPLLAGFGGLDLERRVQRERTRSSPSAPNIVVVLIDTLRADRTSAYGYARETTPHLRALAERGTLFDEAYSTASWTWPSTASLFTGMQPEEHGVVDAGSSFLSERHDTLAEALQRAGFTTAAWSGNPLIVADKNFDQGFELFDAPRDGGLRRTEVMMPSVLDWLDAAAEWRFFLYLHLLDVHLPHYPLPEARERFAADVPASFDPRSVLSLSWELRRGEGFGERGEPAPERVVPPEEQRWISDLYDASVWTADHWLGQVLERLESLGLSERTIVLVTSDHGEELFDRGLLSHGHSLHHELTRVPLVLAGPGIPRGRSAAPISCTRIAPTLARLAGSEIRDLTGALELFRAPAASEETILFSTEQGWWNGAQEQSIFGLRRGAQVLHYAPEGRDWGATQPAAGGQVRLYDLRNDPDEREDLSAREPERALELKDALLQRIRELEARRPRAVQGSDPATLELLRGIGYVGEE